MNNREKALEFIRAKQRVVTIGPTLRELAAHLGVVPNAAQQHVEALREEGFVEKNDGRGIVLVEGKGLTLAKIVKAKNALEAAERSPILKPSGRL